MSEIRALLFDLDGTLADTREPNYLAYAQAMATVGFDLDRTTFERTWGQDSRDFLPRLMPTLDVAGIEAVRAAKSVAYGALLHAAVPNLPLIAFLRAMAPTMATALVTTAKRANADLVLDHFGIRDCFDAFVYGEAVVRGKPDPSAYVLALERLGVNPDQSIAFEDSGTGAAAAAAAGVSVIRVGRFA